MLVLVLVVGGSVVVTGVGVGGVYSGCWCSCWLYCVGVCVGCWFVG